MVIGIMPASFDNVLAPSGAALGAPPVRLSQGRAWGHHLRTIGRLAPGVSIERATREVDAIGRAVLAEQRPETYDPTTRFDATSLRDELTRGVRSALLAILAAVALVLADRERERYEPPARARLRRRGEISSAGGARCRARPSHATAADGNPPPRGDRRHARSHRGRARPSRSRRAQPGRASARCRDRDR